MFAISTFITSGSGTHIFSENSFTTIVSPIVIVHFFFKESETLYTFSFFTISGLGALFPQRTVRHRVIFLLSGLHPGPLHHCGLHLHHILAPGLGLNVVDLRGDGALPFENVGDALPTLVDVSKLAC